MAGISSYSISSLYAFPISYRSQKDIQIFAYANNDSVHNSNIQTLSYTVTITTLSHVDRFAGIYM